MMACGADEERTMTFSGVMTALVTPMAQGAVDEDALRALVRAQIAGGIRGLVACGSTGEAATLTDDEQAHVVRIVVDEAAGRVPVISGVGARSTHGAIAEAQRGVAAGADGLLVVTPAYNKPTQGGLLAHFRAVADATELPNLLYHVPGRTACDLKPATVATLSEHPNVVGIKEATGDLTRSADIRRIAPTDFALLSGDDFTYLPFIATGGDGCISVLSNIAPAQLVAIDTAARAGNRDAALAGHLALLPLMHALFVESNPIPVKTAAAWLGLIPGNELRLPLTPLTEAGAKALEAALFAAGFDPLRAPGAPSTVGA
jgi:4-hydroxy-tetrahydrodipicolinate synthase